jgi:hypothetical protein
VKDYWCSATVRVPLSGDFSLYTRRIKAESLEQSREAFMALLQMFAYEIGEIAIQHEEVMPASAFALLAAAQADLGDSRRI